MRDSKKAHHFEIMLTRTLILCTLLLGTVIADNDPQQASVPDMNKLVDQMVSVLKAYPSLDPLHIPQYHILLRRKVGDTHQTDGHAHVTNVKVLGLSSVHRQGDTKSLEDIKQNDTFTVKLHMGKSNVKVLSDAKVVLGDTQHPNLKINADIVDIAMHFTIAPGRLPGITQFAIDEFKYATFHVEGLEKNDPLVPGLAQTYMAILNRKARYMLTTSIRPLLEEELKNFKMS